MYSAKKQIIETAKYDLTLFLIKLAIKPRNPLWDTVGLLIVILTFIIPFHIGRKFLQVCMQKHVITEAKLSFKNIILSLTPIQLNQCK